MGSDDDENEEDDDAHDDDDDEEEDDELGGSDMDEEDMNGDAEGEGGMGIGGLGLSEDIKERIEEVVEVLSDFREKRQPGWSRPDYVRQLSTDLSDHYGYLPELTEMFLSMLPPAECVEFMTANDKPRPMVIRTNTLKTRRKDLAQALVKRGVSLEPLAAWSKVALKIIDSHVIIRVQVEEGG